MTGAPSPRPLRRRLLGRLACALAILGTTIGVTILHCQDRVAAMAPLVTSDLQALPANAVGVVLGCNPVAHGHQNSYYVYRLRAAATLYQRGLIRRILVSGDNGRRGYDEPSAMKADLMRMGIPSEHIHCDFAGFSTLDSMIRAKEVFGLTRFTVISQRFHCERAIYIARAHGLDVCGFAAHDVVGLAARTTDLREYLARVKAWLDITILDRQPRFLGPTIPITPLRGQA